MGPVLFQIPLLVVAASLLCRFTPVGRIVRSCWSYGNVVPHLRDGTEVIYALDSMKFEADC